MARKDIINQNGTPNWDAIAGFKERLDGHETDLAEIATKIEVNLLDYVQGTDNGHYDLALQRALNFAKTQYTTNGTIVTLKVPDGEFELFATCSLSDTKLNIIMNGFFKAQGNVKKMISLTNCNGKFDMKFKGQNHTLDMMTNIGTQDFSANVSGVVAALYLENCYRSTVNCVGDNFYGRLIESNGSYMNTWGTINGHLVGQTLYIGGSNEAFGSIGHIWSEEYAGSYFNVLDLTVHYYENVILATTYKKGVWFKNCSALWIDHLSIGENSDTYILNFDGCTGVTAPVVYIYGNRYNASASALGALYIKNCDELDLVVNSNAIKGKVMRIEGLGYSNLTILDRNSENLGDITTSSTKRTAHLDLNFKSINRIGTGLTIQRDTVNTPDANLYINEVKLNMVATIDSSVLGATADSTWGADLTIDGESRVIFLPNMEINKAVFPSTNWVRDIKSVIKYMVDSGGTTVSGRTNLNFTIPVSSSSTTITVADANFIIDSAKQSKIKLNGNAVTGVISIKSVDGLGKTLAKNGLIINQLPTGYPPEILYFATATYRLADFTLGSTQVSIEPTGIKIMANLSNVLEICIPINH